MYSRCGSATSTIAIVLPRLLCEINSQFISWINHFSYSSFSESVKFMWIKSHQPNYAMHRTYASAHTYIYACNSLWLQIWWISVSLFNNFDFLYFWVLSQCFLMLDVPLSGASTTHKYEIIIIKILLRFSCVNWFWL